MSLSTMSESKVKSLSFRVLLTMSNMQERLLEMSKKTPEKSEMSELVFASDMMRNRIAPPGSAASKGERITAAARALKWKQSRAAGVWYGDDRISIKPRELRKIEEKSGVTYAEYIEAGREEIRSNDDLIANAEALLAGNEAAFYSAFVAALRALARPNNCT